MKFFRIFLLLVLVLASLVIFHDYWVGLSLQPMMEKQLTEAFAMPVRIDGLKVRLWPPGCISIGKIECLDPKPFRQPVHFRGEGVDLYIDLPALKQKCIRFKKAHFKKFLFVIETYLEGKETHSNTYIWYHHMGLDEEDPPSMNFPKHDAPSLEEAVAAAAQKGKWRVMIDRLDLDDGTLLYDDRRYPASEYVWTFRKLKGYWEGFDCIPGYTSPVFREYIKLEGTFGQNPPARFLGEGKCQFADGDNFDAHISVEGGSIAEYNFLLEGLPGEVRDGVFDIRSHMLCLESDLKSENVLTLRDMKLSSPTLRQKLLKYPFGAVLIALESQKTIQMEVNVSGYIGDPKFHFFQAFTKAFQKSLALKAKNMLNDLKSGTTKIASETPVQVKNGIDQIGGLLDSTLNTLNPLNLINEVDNEKKRK